MKIHMAKNGQKQSYNSYLRVTFISKHSLDNFGPLEEHGARNFGFEHMSKTL